MSSTQSIFICYARADADFVDRLAHDLQHLGFAPFVDREGVEGGQHWRRVLQTNVDHSSMMLVVLSPDAVTSHFVEVEYTYALSIKKPIIPLLLRTCDVPMELRPLQWIEFTGLYEVGLDRLTATLQARQAAATNTPLVASRGQASTRVSAPPTAAPRRRLSPVAAITAAALCVILFAGLLLLKVNGRALGLIDETGTPSPSATVATLIPTGSTDATATATAYPLLTYFAAQPGPCDKGGARWTPTMPTARVQCSADGMEQGNNAGNVDNTVVFFGPSGTQLPANFALDVTFQGLPSSGCVDLTAVYYVREGGLYGYRVLMCANGCWRLDVSPVTSNLAHGCMSATGTFNLGFTSSGTTKTLVVNGQRLASVKDATYTGSTIGEISFYFFSGPDTTVISVSNFDFQAR